MGISPRKRNSCLIKLSERNPQAFEEEMERRRKEASEVTDEKVQKGIHNVDDAIWKSLVYEPYMIANFGSKKAGTRYFSGLMEQEGYEKRIKYLREQGIAEDGKVEEGHEDLKPFTTEGFGERAVNVLVTVLMGIIPCLALMAFAFLVLYWTAIAMGCAILGVIYLLLAFWPGWGFGEVGRWLYRTFTGLFMKVFYAIVLSIFLAIWILIQPGGAHLTSLGLGGRIIVILFLLFGFWTSVEALRRKLTNVPTLSGGTLSMEGVGDGDLGAAKGGVSGMTRKGWNGMKRWREKNKQKVDRQVQEGRANRRNQQLIAAMNGQDGGGGKERSNRLSLGGNQPIADSGLSKEAKGTFREMKRQGKDPMNQEDRVEWALKHPEAGSALKDINNWSQNKLPKQAKSKPYTKFDGSNPPPRKPRKNTPEYEIWKNSPEWQIHSKIYEDAKKRVDDQHREKYRAEYRKYEQSFARYFKKPPKYKEPSKSTYLKEYRNAVKSDDDIDFADEVR